MPEQVNLETLSNDEIKKLWQEQTARARQRSEEPRIPSEPEEGFYRDAHGNIVEGKKPQPKTAGHYVDERGYVQDLKPGERPPALSGNGLVDWLNQQDIASDPELKDALGETYVFFEGQTTVGDDEIVLTGKLERGGWSVDSRSQNPALNLGFRLSRSLTRDQAVEQAVLYIESKAGPQFKTLSENEERMIERMAVTNRLQAFVFYIQARLPDDLANRFLELGEAGDELGIQRFASQEKISEIVEEGVAYTFYWNNPRATEEFFEWIRSNDGGRLWSFMLLDSLWKQYSVDSSLEKITEAQNPVPTPEELDQLSDEEIERTLTEARKLRARNQIR